MATTDKSRSAFRDMNARAFGGYTGRRNENAKRNAAVLRKMTICERDTGMTAEQLREYQQMMRASVLARLEAAS